MYLEIACKIMSSHVEFGMKLRGAGGRILKGNMLVLSLG